VAYSYGVKCEFLRWVYATAASDSTTTTLVLDGLRDTAFEAAASGKSLIGTSANGNSASFALFASWNPDNVLELINWARAFISETDADAALALVGGPARNVRPEFTAMEV